MRTVDIKDKIKEAKLKLPPVESFWKIGDLTALRIDSAGRFYKANYERGLLLYTLITLNRPRTVLEFGTGRGYGSLCMARAMVDNNIDGTIYTIDTVKYDQKQVWAINRGGQSAVENLSLKEVWTANFPAEWVEKIHLLNGRSDDVMGKWRELKLPPVQFAFIDGGHGYMTVKHDFYSFLRIASRSFHVLFDDYTNRPDFGIQRLIDEEVSKVFNVELIWCARRWYGGEKEYETNPEYGMVLLDSQNTSDLRPDLLTVESVEEFLSKYERQRKRESRTQLLKTIARPLIKVIRPRNK